MKSRKNKISLQGNKLLSKRSDVTLDFSRAKTFSTTSLQNNIKIIQQHSKLFAKNRSSCSGDADSYFKQSLRSYEFFDFRIFQPSFKNCVTAPTFSSRFNKNSTLSEINVIKQQSLVRGRPKQKSKYTTSDRREIKRELFPEALPHYNRAAVSNSSEELDFEIFYSPSSRTYQSSTEIFRQEQSETDLEVISKDFTMAEDQESELAEMEAVLATEAAVENLEPTTPPTQELVDVGGDEEEEELKEVERMLQDAGEELGGVAAETKYIMSEIEEAEEEAEEKAGGDGSTFKFDPTVDAAVLKELEAAEKQAKDTAKIIFELKIRVTELLKKEHTTESEARELEQKNRELRKQMMLFEEKTKRIQCLIAQTNLFESMIPVCPTLQVKHKEDDLPKVIVCGVTENNMPKLIVCDDKKIKKTQLECGCDAPQSLNVKQSPGVDCYQRASSPKPTKQICADTKMPMSVVPKFAKRLSDSYCMQEKLAAENADLEGMRYKLQADLLSKDQTIEYLQQKLCSIQYEMRMICKENLDLNERVDNMCSVSNKQENKCKKPCGKGKGKASCPAEIENRLNTYSETTKVLEKQLADMENEVKNMQTELCTVQAERDHLEQHRKILICPTPICVPTPCPPPCPPSPYSVCAPPQCPMPCPQPCPVMPQSASSSDQQMRELREKYCRLQDDFKSKVTEVASLRADNEKQKTTASNAEEAKKLMDEKIKELERNIRLMKLEKNQFAGSKEQLIEQESQLAVAKERFRLAQDELEEAKAFIEDQKGQVNDYRNKYMEAQQTVEEQRRQIDILEMDANRVNEQVNLEIQRVKNQFQEKLQELLPLPDMLKTTQLKLSEIQQMHMLAERNNEALNKELQLYKDQVAAINDQMQQVRSDQQLDEDGRMSMAQRVRDMEIKLNELVSENDQLRVELQKMEDLANDNETKAQEKVHEIVQLQAQLELVREETARQVARNKERCEMVRRSMQNQISDLERQLAHSRAQARTAQKDRDEIRQKMQAQINNLHENFEDAQMRIRNLQGHVNFLKDSYNTPTISGLGIVEPPSSDNQDACLCGNEY